MEQSIGEGYRCSQARPARVATRIYTSKDLAHACGTFDMQDAFALSSKETRDACPLETARCSGLCPHYVRFRTGEKNKKQRIQEMWVLCSSHDNGNNTPAVGTLRRCIGTVRKAKQKKAHKRETSVSGE